MDRELKKRSKFYLQNKYVENNSSNFKLFESKKKKLSKFERTLLSASSSFDQVMEYDKDFDVLVKNSPNTHKAILIVVALRLFHKLINNID